jgi:flagellar biosynthesis/type III secretory pathway protein FliH
MIIRDAVISEDRRIVGRAVRPAVTLSAISADIVRDVVRAGTVLSESTSDATVEVPLLLPSWQERQPTFEAVAAWLAVQDSETRSACASLLADDLTHVREAAKADGFAEGRVQGAKEARDALSSRLALLDSTVQAAQTAFDEDRERLAEACTEIVAEAFAKIAGTALVTREAVVAVVAEVLKRVKDAHEVTIRVSPAELDIFLRDEGAHLAAALPGRKLLIVADSQVGLGGCIVDSKLGSLDGRLEAQLRGLYETLRAAKSMRAERA